MRKIFYFVALGLMVLSSCSQEENEFLNEDLVSKVETKALNIGDSSSVITPLVVDSNQIEMAKTKKVKAYYDVNDPYYSSNMYAIRELPIFIKARGNGCFLSSNGIGKEITLSPRINLRTSKFYLKILPSSSGIPYLIYSYDTQTPLSVGQYDNDPENKVLFARMNDSGTTMSADWDLIPSSTHKGYFVIESQSYLGQADSNNPWSIFNYVLETKSNTKLGFGQYTKKPEQEFLISLVDDFTLHHIEFHKEGSLVTKRAPIKLITYGKNEADEVRPFNIIGALYASDEYYFSESSALKLTPANSEKLFYRPNVSAESVQLPLPVAPEDDPAPIREKADMIYSTNRQVIERTLNFEIKGTAPANCSIEATSFLENYNVSIGYTAYMKYNHNGDERLVKINGTWHGIICTTLRDDDYPNDLLRFFDLDTRNEIIFPQ